MSLDSILAHRLFLWITACDAWSLDVQHDEIRTTADTGTVGQLEVRAGRSTVLGGNETNFLLEVSEVWQPGRDPGGDRRLESEACHLVALSWHLQTGRDPAGRDAERLDVGVEDQTHPRVHRHPFGRPNTVRHPSEFPPPDAWLHNVNEILGGALADGLIRWSDVSDQED